MDGVYWSKKTDAQNLYIFKNEPKKYENIIYSTDNEAPKIFQESLLNFKTWTSFFFRIFFTFNLDFVDLLHFKQTITSSPTYYYL